MCSVKAFLEQNHVLIMIFSWFSYTLSKGILKKTTNSIFILVKRGWILSENKVEKKRDFVIAVKIGFLLCYFHEKITIFWKFEIHNLGE